MPFDVRVTRTRDAHPPLHPWKRAGTSLKGRPGRQRAEAREPLGAALRSGVGRRILRAIRMKDGSRVSRHTSLA